MNNLIFIYGASGAGKTHVSLVLQKRLKTSLFEADSIRDVVQKDTTKEKDPLLFLGTAQAYKHFGGVNPENCVKGLLAVREAMAGFVGKEIQNKNKTIIEGAFLDPNKLIRHGKMLLIVTTDESGHKKHFFEHRPENQDNIDEFRSARMVQDYLIEEARNLDITIIENNDELLSQLEEIIYT